MCHPLYTHQHPESTAPWWVQLSLATGLCDVANERPVSVLIGCLYELVRRRCRYIIACDGGSDANFSFENLGNAIEKCRTDFGIDIDIGVDEIRPKAGSTQQSQLREDDKNESEWHCAVGTITYKDAPPGTLLYLKSSLTGNEPTDVKRYKALEPDFPHHSTADQFFDESQFESYRRLGRHIVEETLGKAVPSDQLEKMPTKDIFRNLSAAWPSKTGQKQLGAVAAGPNA